MTVRGEEREVEVSDGPEAGRNVAEVAYFAAEREGRARGALDLAPFSADEGSSVAAAG